MFIHDHKKAQFSNADSTKSLPKPFVSFCIVTNVKLRCVAPGFYNTILGSQENLMSINVRIQRYLPPTNFKKAALNQTLSPLTSSEMSNILKTAIAMC